MRQNKDNEINGNFIKLYRKFINWEWYTSNNEKAVFLHLLILSSWEDQRYKGIEIKRGQCYISISQISRELGLTNQNVRTAIKKLTLTRELTHHTERGKSIFTIVSYNDYQTTNKETNKSLTNGSQMPNKSLTNGSHNISKELKEEEEEKERVKSKGVSLPYKSEKFEQSWREWKEYKKLDHKFKFKSLVSEKAALTSLSRLGSNEDECIAIIYQSIENGWKGFFELREPIKHKEQVQVYETEMIDDQLYELRECPNDPLKSRERRKVGYPNWSNDSNFQERRKTNK
tara:strand:- start:7786 stop:8646 length:861 start_codon:yes stop_codon:yes gene_type:complete